MFDLTKILLPKHLVLTYSLIAKVMYYQILFTELLYPVFSLAHKSENVYNLSDILIRDHDVRTYFTGPHKILHFAGSGHRRILELWGGNLLSRDP